MASICLFDDNPKASRSIEKFLEKTGNHVFVFNTLDELEEKISEIEKSDVIVMDVICRSKKLAQRMGTKEEYVGPYGLIFVEDKWGQNKNILDKIVLMSTWDDPWIEDTAKKIDCPLFHKSFHSIRCR